MITINKAKKYGAFLLTGMLPVIFFILGVSMFDFITAILFIFIGIFGSTIIGSIMLRNAFTQMIEGSGLMTLTLDSTGVVQPFITTLDAPYIHGTLKKKEVDGVYNRDMVGYITPAAEGKLHKIPGEFWNDGKDRTVLEMPTEEEKTDYLFRMNQWPCFFFNKNIDAYLSKDSLSTFEKETFTKNNSLFILKKTQQLSADVRDFVRYIVEHAKPKRGGLFQNKGLLAIILVIIMIVIFVLLFGPSILGAITGAANQGAVLPSGGPIS